jgi:hypothetical protein
MTEYAFQDVDQIWDFRISQSWSHVSRLPSDRAYSNLSFLLFFSLSISFPFGFQYPQRRIDGFFDFGAHGS